MRSEKQINNNNKTLETNQNAPTITKEPHPSKARMTPSSIRNQLVQVDDMPRDMRIIAEDDSFDDNRLVESQMAPTQTPSAPPVVPGVVKPIAMKVIRPIPKRVSEQFYNEAYEGGLKMLETSQATMLAHEWHRKWTQQDENNHTMPEQDFYEQTSAMLPIHYGLVLDRQGAKNPSLGDHSDENTISSMEERGKRTLSFVVAASQIASSSIGPELGYFEQCQHPRVAIPGIHLNPEDRMDGHGWSDASSSSLLSSQLGPQVKRRYTGAVFGDDGDEDEHDQPPLMPIRPLAVRPTPVRISRPSYALDPGFENLHREIPHDISALRNESVSPMNSSPSSLSSTNSSIGSLMQTVWQPERHHVHIIEDDEAELTLEDTFSALESKEQATPSEIEVARDSVLHALAVTKGDVDSDVFRSSIDPLEKYYSKQELDSRPQVIGSDSISGMWLTLSKPTFFGCLGENDNGDPMYTLGRMSFDMFSPTNLVCSLQGNFNPVEVVNEEDRKAMLEAVPKSLREEVESGTTVLRTYHVVTAFTIEPNLAAYPTAPNKDVSRPIKGIMTTFGYSLPDPNTPNRHSIWFTGGRIEPNDNESDISAWKKLFTMHPPMHTFGEKAKLLAVKLLMGASVPKEVAEDGSMEYTFSRPLGGHGMAYVDVIYLDESMRIVRGHRGTTFVFSRVPER